jgi:hypothetical protein
LTNHERHDLLRRLCEANPDILEFMGTDNPKTKDAWNIERHFFR